MTNENADPLSRLRWLLDTQFINGVGLTDLQAVILQAVANEIERLREILTYTTLTPNAPAEQFKAVLDAAEKGEFVNAQDLINALWWRVRNQRGELRKKNQDVERLRAEVKCPCGVAYLRVEGGYVPVCACATKNAVTPQQLLG